MRKAFRAIAVLFVGVAAAGCSSTASSGAAAPSQPAVCSSLNGLQTSVTNLRHVDVSAAGIAAVQNDLAAVGANVRQVVDDAKGQYATNVDQLQRNYGAVQSAATAAKATPTAGTLSTFARSVGALADGVKVLADDVASTC
jgi:hypothetical protein